MVLILYSGYYTLPDAGKVILLNGNGERARPEMLLIHTLFLPATDPRRCCVNAIARPRLRRRFKSPNDQSQRNVKLDVISRLRHREKMSRQRFEGPNGTL